MEMEMSWVFGPGGSGAYGVVGKDGRCYVRYIAVQREYMGCCR